MPQSEPENSRLHDYRFQMGHDAGNLALALDQLTDALHLIGQHTVYCRVEKGLRTGEPPRDVAELTRLVQATKDLVQDSLLRLRAAQG